MELAVGQVLEGTVTGITKFGAFVSLEGGKSGLVHISEVANAYVSDVHDHVEIGQKVKVKVLSLGEAGKINLSIKRAQESPPDRLCVKLPAARPGCPYCSCPPELRPGPGPGGPSHGQPGLRGQAEALYAGVGQQNS
ncbi:MAG: S1 RNA-binding domain-containing protein [Oscillospiraceae bacterium]